MRLATVFLFIAIGLASVAVPVEKNAKIGPGLDAELSIHGYVIENGSKVVGATVVVSCPRTNFRTETMTSSLGRYSFSKLPPESYQISTTVHGKTSSVSIVLSDASVKQDLVVQ